MYLRSTIDAVMHADPVIDNKNNLEVKDRIDVNKEDGNGNGL